jgi:hypothetical protein
MGGLPGSAGAAQAPSHALHATHLRAMYDVGIPHTVTNAEVARAALTTGALKTFTASVSDPSTLQSYTYSMVGKNPAHASTNPATAVKTLLIPVKIKFTYGGLSWDPTVADGCDSGATALARVQQSPIFASQAWTFGGTTVGSSQYVDAFQRAAFWKYAQPSGKNPGYGVSLTLKTLGKITITVPSTYAFYYSGRSCGSGNLGDISINWLDSYLQSKVIPSLAAKGLKPNTFPIFLVHNVVEYTGTNAGSCCVLGYHNSYSNANGVQTYGVVDYDNEATFPGASDVAVLSHEVAEWMDDPFTNNPTAPWGHVGQVTSCQSNLEVGDPLSDTTMAVTTGGFTYHVQELAFFSWFYHQKPSLGVNGWYSDNGTFTTPAAACS